MATGGYEDDDQLAFEFEQLSVRAPGWYYDSSLTKPNNVSSALPTRR